MLRVKTFLDKSTIHGIGLFAAEPIVKGTVTWKYDPGLDTTYSESDIQKMPEPAKDIFFNYAFYDKQTDKYILCADDLRFINHTDENYNIQSTPYEDRAARDIKKGEELLCNYTHYEDTFFTRKEIDTSSLK